MAPMTATTPLFTIKEVPEDVVLALVVGAAVVPEGDVAVEAAALPVDELARVKGMDWAAVADAVGIIPATWYELISVLCEEDVYTHQLCTETSAELVRPQGLHWCSVA